MANRPLGTRKINMCAMTDRKLSFISAISFHQELAAISFHQELAVLS